jgi:hypothetical protein
LFSEGEQHEAVPCSGWPPQHEGLVSLEAGAQHEGRGSGSEAWVWQEFMAVSG